MRYKYNILKILHSRTYKEYLYIRKEAPKKLGISKRTWERWLYIKEDDKAEINYSTLKKISELLNVSIEDLINI